MLNMHHRHPWAVRSTQHACPGGKVALAGRVVAGSHRIPVCSATSATATDSADEASNPKPRKVRRTRLFGSDGNEAEQPAHAAASLPAGAKQSPRAAPEPPAVSDEFRKAFESLGIQVVPVQQAPRRQERRDSAADVDRQDSQRDSSESDGSSSSRREGRESKLDRFREWGRDRSLPSSSSSSKSKQQGAAWSGRGRQADRDDPPADIRDFGSGGRGKLSPEERRRQWEAEAAERQRLAEEAERKRLIRKERSERIPEKPKPKQDKVIFQAITREWDEKVSQEERRGARAAARKIANLGLYDRNKTVRKLRQKYAQGKINEQQDPEAQKVAQRAVEQVQEAAALSIQPPKELLYQEAAGVKRSFARAEALPEGEWERLKEQYKAADSQIKIGRKGCTPQLVTAIQNAWRGREVVKLRVHDDKSARKVCL
eukprot:GHUV01016006.1.p1 GENE.GHUV01016006.1~~GHUV01016006.1.p1  ORF type:complete len:429 (+),score=108.73 GHUV01016006.1:247-1533(+)